MDLRGSRRGDDNTDPNAYFILVVLPIFAGFTGLRALWTFDDVPTHGMGLLLGSALAGLAVNTAAAWRARTGRGRLPVYILSVGGPVTAALTFTHRHLPPWLVVSSAVFLTVTYLVQFVVVMLELAGIYRIEPSDRHRATVCLVESGQSRKAETWYYQAVCECSWKSPQFILDDDDDSEEQAFARAREHTPNVRRWVSTR
jgi:hypothetical protein